MLGRRANALASDEPLLREATATEATEAPADETESWAPLDWVLHAVEAQSAAERRAEDPTDGEGEDTLRGLERDGGRTERLGGMVVER